MQGILLEDESVDVMSPEIYPFRKHSYCRYSHFTNGETKVERLSNLPWIPLPASGKPRIGTSDLTNGFHCHLYKGMAWDIRCSK